MQYFKKSMPDFRFINHITMLMETHEIELALEIIFRSFDDLSIMEKKLLSLNIIEATKQYDIKNYRLPDSYFEFLVSDDSNDIFF